MLPLHDRSLRSLLPPTAMRRLLPPTALALFLLVVACDSGPDAGIPLDEAVQGRWVEEWVDHGASIVIVGGDGICTLPPTEPCPAYVPEVFEHVTTLDLGDGLFTAATVTYAFREAGDRSDTLQTTHAYRKGWYTVAGDTLALTSDEETERYVAVLAADSLRLRDADACVLEDEGFCALNLYEVGLPWAEASALIKTSGSFGRE